MALLGALTVRVPWIDVFVTKVVPVLPALPNTTLPREVTKPPPEKSLPLLFSVMFAPAALVTATSELAIMPAVWVTGPPANTRNEPLLARLTAVSTAKPLTLLDWMLSVAPRVNAVPLYSRSLLKLPPCATARPEIVPDRVPTGVYIDSCSLTRPALSWLVVMFWK